MKARKTKGTVRAKGTKKTAEDSNEAMTKTVGGRVKKLRGNTVSVANVNEMVNTTDTKRLTRKAAAKSPVSNEAPSKVTNSDQKSTASNAAAQKPEPRKRAPVKRKPLVPSQNSAAPLKPTENEDSNSSGEDSATDTELEEEGVKTPDWYTTQSKTCQKCKNTYDSPGEGAACLVSHDRLRCYFCFRVVKNTEELFQHFGRVHRKDDAPPGCVKCPVCEKIVQFKAISCHVISWHLGLARKQPELLEGNDRRPTYKATKNTKRSSTSTAWKPRAKKPPVKTQDPITSSEDDDVSSTDSEMDEEAMQKWQYYLSKAKTCQKCKKDYDSPGEASNCISSHKRLRCYFCFRVVKDTEQLFEHYERVHRKGDVEAGRVICPACDESILFKAVSCHVISMHMRENAPIRRPRPQAQPVRRRRARTSAAAGRRRGIRPQNSNPH